MTMINKGQIAAVKAAQRDAGLDDGAYRDLLRREAGVSSCKDLEPDQVAAVIAAIRALEPHRKNGWQLRQIRTFRKYVDWCGMNPVQGRVFLHERTGKFHEDDPDLDQHDFEDAMAELEERLEQQLHDNEDRIPGLYDLQYWRRRRPRAGAATSRELWAINTAWKAYSHYLPEEKQTDNYLLGMSAQAIGRRVDRLQDLSATEAGKLIDCLKNKLKHEQSKLEQEVPF